MLRHGNGHPRPSALGLLRVMRMSTEDQEEVGAGTHRAEKRHLARAA